MNELKVTLTHRRALGQDMDCVSPYTSTSGDPLLAHIVGCLYTCSRSPIKTAAGHRVYQLHEEETARDQGKVTRALIRNVFSYRVRAHRI